MSAATKLTLAESSALSDRYGLDVPAEAVEEIVALRTKPPVSCVSPADTATAVFPQAAVATLSDLTLAEMGELHRAVDGPITPQMIADKIRLRSDDPPKSREQQLRDLLASHIAQATEYLECRDIAKSRGHDATADLYNTKAMTYLGFADACERELESQLEELAHAHRKHPCAAE